MVGFSSFSGMKIKGRFYKQISKIWRNIVNNEVDPDLRKSSPKLEVRKGKKQLNLPQQNYYNSQHSCSFKLGSKGKVGLK